MIDRASRALATFLAISTPSFAVMSPGLAFAQDENETAAEAGTKAEEDAPRGEAAPAANPPEMMRSRWKTTFYGFIELDALADSTQSFAEPALNNPVAPRGTYLGDYGQTQMTAKNSRLGFRLEPPDFAGMSAYAQVEFDFFGVSPTEVQQTDYYVMGPMRLRHAFFVLKTPVIDLTAGQYPNLFGWGGSGFSPSTVAFLGVPGQVYHRDAQVRLSKTFGEGSAASVEIAAAAVRPVQRQARIPDIEGGVRFALNGLKGPSTQGNAQPELVPLSVGLSGMSRNFAVAEYLELPRKPVKATGWGAAVNVLVPLIPAKSVDDRANSVTLTGEYSIGTGIADRYASLTGGARFQSLPNPRGLARPPLYRPNIDNGLVNFDYDDNLKTIDWKAFVVGAQYYLPIFSGRVWVTGTFARLESANIAELTPVPNHGNIFTKAQYMDGNLFMAITPAVQLGLSLQVTDITRADGAVPRNLRGHGALNFFF